MPTRHAVPPFPVEPLLPAPVNDPPDAPTAGSRWSSEQAHRVSSGGGSSEVTAADSAPEDGDVRGDAAALVLEERFSIVPEWVLDADVSDAAVRLYAVLLRYGQSSGQRMPSRRTLADRMRKRSVDSVDRALKELVAIGAVEVTRRSRGGLSLTNRYLVRSTRPGRRRPDCAGGGGRTGAATPTAGTSTGRAARPVGRACERGSSRIRAARGGRTDAAGVAARLRPDRESLTENQPPPPPSSIRADALIAVAEAADADGGELPVDREGRRRRVLAMLGVGDLGEVADRCAGLRRQQGLPAGLWTAQRLTDLVADAVLALGFPVAASVPALLTLAADPATRSPARLRCPGPWWDTAAVGDGRHDDGWPTETAAEVAALETVLAEVGGLRVALQRQARAQLSSEGLPVTRGTVARRAVDLLAARSGRDDAAKSGWNQGAIGKP